MELGDVSVNDSNPQSLPKCGTRVELHSRPPGVLWRVMTCARADEATHTRGIVSRAHAGRSATTLTPSSLGKRAPHSRCASTALHEFMLRMHRALPTSRVRQRCRRHFSSGCGARFGTIAWEAQEIAIAEQRATKRPQAPTRRPDLEHAAHARPELALVPRARTRPAIRGRRAPVARLARAPRVAVRKPEQIPNTKEPATGAGSARSSASSEPHRLAEELKEGS
jgi:hypothetical protein